MKYDLPNNRTLELNQEECADSPRNWDNLARMIFFGNHKHLGDNHNVVIETEYNSREEFISFGAEEVKKQLKDVVVCKAVHLYDHSGVSISTENTYPFNCRWDSGTIGFVVVTKEDIRNNWGLKRVTQKYIDWAEELADGEVKTLNQYISGDIYYFNIEDEDGETEDSCGGFFGSDILENGVLDHIGEEDRNFIKKSLEV